MYTRKEIDEIAARAGMTRKDLIKAGMAARGWEFFPTGPNEWDWIKFDSEEKEVARQGSEEWHRDLETVTIGADRNFK